MKVVLIPGTHAWPPATSAWYLPGSPFCREVLGARSHTCLRDEPFMWSTDVDGVPFDRHHADWEAGACALSYYLRDIPLDDRNLIAHSHGGQVAILAAQHVLLNKVWTVATPVRSDMKAAAEKASVRIARWTHLSAQGDWMQMLGALFDGSWGIFREMPAAHRNFRMPKKAGHSGALNESVYFPQWGEWL